MALDEFGIGRRYSYRTLTGQFISGGFHVARNIRVDHFKDCSKVIDRWILYYTTQVEEDDEYIHTFHHNPSTAEIEQEILKWRLMSTE